ncbi:hypothetical protein KFL_001900010 [Klebsormidium nitens]|uniref:Uncharacterized protein n=1 Tax=Klebsormidium nitens TaxID=105231 RepID=A0A1Y1I8N6_KLENI|nr:hypothetical protein KFL_001900010 [Klebsormidium nitens]|eukprot:GAQ84458.1 hypothetical protein KFL_001900010 [Klebsormidium nitens]
MATGFTPVGKPGGMVRRLVPFCVLVLLLVPAFPRCEAGGFPDLDDLEDLDEAKLASQLLRLADLPLFAQKALLRVLGAGLVDLDELPCNIFGGVSACQDLPPDSRIVHQCAGVNTRVDCAFRGSAMQQASEDPDAALRTRLEGLGHRPCEPCYQSLQRFWCGQAVPKCGTFDKVIDKILPLLSRVATDEEDYDDALSEAVPDILGALSMGLPCREMCDVVTQTCGCGDPETFGEVLTSVHEEAEGSPESAARAANMSYSAARTLFKRVWDTPICELFARESTPGFHGVCELPPGAQSPCDWCSAKRPQVQLVWQQMVAQVSQSISSMMSAGLDRVMSPGRPRWEGRTWGGTDGTERASSAGSEQKETDGGSQGHSWVWVWVILLPCAMAFFAGLGYASYYVYDKRYNVGRRYVDLGDIGEEDDDKYSPPML